MRKPPHNQPRKASTNTLPKASKKKDIELTEKELGKVSGGVGSQPPKGQPPRPDWSGPGD